MRGVGRGTKNRAVTKVGASSFRCLLPGVALALAVALAIAWPAGTAAAQATSAARSNDLAMVERTQDAFARGDAQALLRQAGERVELAVLGASTLYSRAQATYVLQEFFRNYPPARFTTDRPSAADQNLFVVGRYWFGSEGQYLDVYLRFRTNGEGGIVREVRIERPTQ